MKRVLLFVSIFAVTQPFFSQETFFPQNSGVSVRLNAIDFVTNAKGMCVGAQGTIRKTVNSGLNWLSSNSGTQSDLNAIVSQSENTFIAVGKTGTILKTTNFGDSWTSMNSGTSVELTSVFGIGSTFYVTCADGTLLKSTNNGNAWSPLGTNVLLRLNDVFFVSETIGFAVGNNGTLLKTTNGGNYWNVLNVAVGNFHLKSVVFHDFTHGIVCGVDTQNNQSVVLRTSNAGTSWQEEYYTGYSFEKMDFADYSTGMVVGGDLPGAVSAIFKTTSQGAAWTEQTSSSFKQLGITYVNSGLAYSCGMNGTILRMTLNELNTEESAPVNGMTVYPNPSTGMVYVQCEPPVENISCIVLTDVKGKVLKMVKNAHELDLRECESGMYYLYIQTDTHARMIRLEKL